MKLLLAAASAAALLAASASPSSAALQVYFSDGTNHFACVDGDGSCDTDGSANGLETINTTVGNFFIKGTSSTATAGPVNFLDFSSFRVQNNGTAESSVTLQISATNFADPVTFIEESASLTFHDNVGAGVSTISFYADTANGQGAPGTPGALLFTATGAALTNPDSFDGTQLSAFLANNPFSMTEVINLDLRAGGSVTGFDASMQSGASAVPEAKTWAMATIGFGLLAAIGFRRNRSERALIA